MTDSLFFCKTPSPSVVIEQKPTQALSIVTPDGRTLLRVAADGAVDGAMEDMGEAAAIFVRNVRSLLAETAS